MATKNKLPHTGEHLAEFMAEFGLNDRKLAQATGLKPDQIGQIRRGLRSISPTVALKLGRYFGTSPQFWANLQSQFDLKQAELGADLESIVPIKVAEEVGG
ncbi:MAG: addiction module antidote protein, HigA family [Candidatus Lambdaproteobacteria bacterium RIFOXYD2_FULL_50_16]|uniref:Addiction module antidote protein, HigA family n=1 Tax=Candidatus Lambdaproteobacteria bacterium RIFOXYD2_FULL_50_16 TaxID=1817772 RepID=A0A1F6G4P0_9PROT|nr:MAG: addiction module antidote protein, HigA family [Candidatus Lambdaproteobacteria bacterium RIFOXYD2_FULL_50_16]